MWNKGIKRVRGGEEGVEDFERGDKKEGIVKNDDF